METETVAHRWCGDGGRGSSPVTAGFDFADAVDIKDGRLGAYQPRRRILNT